MRDRDLAAAGWEGQMEVTKSVTQDFLVWMESRPSLPEEQLQCPEHLQNVLCSFSCACTLFNSFPLPALICFNHWLESNIVQLNNNSWDEEPASTCQSQHFAHLPTAALFIKAALDASPKEIRICRREKPAHLPTKISF